MIRHQIRSGFVGAALVALVTAPAHGQAPSDTSVLVDRVFGGLNRADAPGCTLGVDRDAAPLIRRGYGMASLESRTPLTESTVLESGSVAKQFTAAAIVHLALQGKLDLDDPVRKYLPELPDYGSPVTIRMLLHHTSGVRDMWTLFALAGNEPGTSLFTMPQALRMVYRQRQLNFAPNDRYLYSNSGFLLLSEIVKRVSGIPLSQFSREVFFRPLGMDHTQWRDDWNRVVPGRATAYSPAAEGGLRVDMPFMSVYGAGGLLTTVGDLLKWNANLEQPKVGGAAWADTMQRRGRLNSGRTIDYGLGLIVTSYRGEREISHSGATGGYRTYLARWPDRRLSLAILCNVANANPIALGHQVADIYLGLKPIASAATSPSLANVETGPVAPLLGRYRASATEEVLTIGEKDGRLVVDLGAPFALTAVTRDHFRATDINADLVFLRTGDRVSRLTVVVDGDSTAYDPVAVLPSRPEELAGFVADYRSDELDVTYRVSSASTDLMVQIGEHEPVTATRTGPDSFVVPGGAAVRFTRTKGRIDGFLLFAGRVKNLRFARQSR